MSKTNRIYKIFMTTMIVAIAGMLLAMGIIAAQKTMKLGVQFSSNPNYKLEVFINNEETLIFRNFADNETGKTVKMDNGITSLNGDTLVADEEAFKDYGNDFTIIIKNYTESTGIEVAMESTAKIESGADGIPAQIETEDNTASKYNPDTKVADSVSFRIYINSVFPQTTTLKMTISELSTYTITYDANGGSFENSQTISSVSVTVGSSYELPTPPTQTEYTFLGWADDSSDTSPEWENGTKLANADTTWYAVWQAYVGLTVDLRNNGYYTDSYRMIIVATTDPDFSYDCDYDNDYAGSLSYTKGPNASQFFYLEPTLTTTENKEYSLKVPVGAKVLIGALNVADTSTVGYIYHSSVYNVSENITISSSYEFPSVAHIVSCIYFLMPSTPASVTFEMDARELVASPDDWP